MTPSLPASPRLSFHPLSPDRWPDLEALFGARGACAGCWCMWWRLARSQWTAQRGDGNRAAFKQIVDSGALPGIIAYDGPTPVGWCAVQPREAYPGLERSRILKRVDAEPVWSIVCLFVLKSHRKQGISVKLLEAAVEHVGRQGGGIVEGYPVEPNSPQADAFVYTGLASAFRQAGFQEVAHPSATRFIMRRAAPRPRNKRAAAPSDK